MLAHWFLRRFTTEFGQTGKRFSTEAISAIAGASWPGNVRELENRVKRAVVMSDGKIIDIRAARLKAERHVIQLALAQSNGVISTAAKLMRISRPTLYGLLEEHGLSELAGTPRKGESITSL
jgi:two-component system NtrC family response regulator